MTRSEFRIISKPDSNIHVGMARPLIAVFYLLAMVAVMVAVDVFFFSNHLWARPLANIGMVLLFVAFYLRFFRRP